MVPVMACSGAGASLRLRAEACASTTTVGPRPMRTARWTFQIDFNFVDFHLMVRTDAARRALRIARSEGRHRFARVDY
jgi:hypothetical protein